MLICGLQTLTLSSKRKDAAFTKSIDCYLLTSRSNLHLVSTLYLYSLKNILSLSLSLIILFAFQCLAVLSCVLVTALSAPTYPKEVPSSPGISYDKPAPAHSKGMPYNYNWAVADNDAGQDDQDVKKTSNLPPSSQKQDLYLI